MYLLERQPFQVGQPEREADGLCCQCCSGICSGSGVFGEFSAGPDHGFGAGAAEPVESSIDIAAEAAHIDNRNVGRP